MSDRETIIEKLKKIKAHADSAAKIGSENEAVAFGKKLRELMLQHNIDASVFDMGGDACEIIEKWMEWDEMKTYKSRHDWIDALVWMLAKAYSCRALAYAGSGRHKIIGHAGNVALAEYAMITIRRMAELVVGKRWERFYDRRMHRGEYTPMATDWKNGFLLGMVHRLAERFEELKRVQDEALQEENCTAMVLVRRQEEDVVKYIAANIETTTSNRRVKHVDASGYKSGQRFADKLDIGNKALR